MSRGNCCANSGWVFGWFGEGLSMGVWGVAPLSCSKACPGPGFACSTIVKGYVRQAGQMLVRPCMDVLSKVEAAQPAVRTTDDQMFNSTMN